MGSCPWVPHHQPFPTEEGGQTCCSDTWPLEYTGHRACLTAEQRGVCVFPLHFQPFSSSSATCFAHEYLCSGRLRSYTLPDWALEIHTDMFTAIVPETPLMDLEVNPGENQPEWQRDLPPCMARSTVLRTCTSNAFLVFSEMKFPLCPVVRSLSRATPLSSLQLRAHHESPCHPGLAWSPTLSTRRLSCPGAEAFLSWRDLRKRQLAGHVTWSSLHPVDHTYDGYPELLTFLSPQVCTPKFCALCSSEKRQVGREEGVFHWLVCSHWWEGNLKTWL